MNNPFGPAPCLITQERGPSDAIRCCQLLHGTEAQIENWRKMWGPDFFIQSFQNQVVLRADWENMLRAHRWAFVPQEETLTDMLSLLLEHKERGVRPLMSTLKISHGRTSPPSAAPLPPFGYEYQFVPLALEGSRIHREIPVGLLNFGNPHGQQMAIQTFSPPYDNFPDVSWNLHPFFAIQSAWEHFSARVTELTPQQRTIYAHLFTIIKLLEEMVDLPVEEEPNDNEEDETEDDDAEEDEIKAEDISARKRSRIE